MLAELVDKVNRESLVKPDKIIMKKLKRQPMASSTFSVLIEKINDVDQLICTSYLKITILSYVLDNKQNHEVLSNCRQNKRISTTQR